MSRGGDSTVSPILVNYKKIICFAVFMEMQALRRKMQRQLGERQAAKSPEGQETPPLWMSRKTSRDGGGACLENFAIFLSI